MRLGSGIAPVVDWLANQVPVGLGVDGSASNDGSHLLAEARMAKLLARVAPNRYQIAKPGEGRGFAGHAGALSPRQVLEMATRGGAAVLGRDDIGYLAPGMSADFVAINLNKIALAGAIHDFVAALVLCQPQDVDYSVINGRFVVKEGQLTTIDTREVIKRHNEISIEMVDGC
jgi:cytosine/adenosine deaminase-related metal-dependent hydrolase